MCLFKAQRRKHLYQQMLSYTTLFQVIWLRGDRQPPPTTCVYLLPVDSGEAAYLLEDAGRHRNRTCHYFW